MSKVTAYGWIDKDGVLHLHNRKRMQEELRQIKPCDVELTIKKRGKRSLPQNNFYWAVVVKEIQVAFNERGVYMNDEEVHTFLKLHFNPVFMRGEEDEAIQLPGSTAELNKDGFSEYIERIAEWAAKKLDLVLPEPNTQTQLFNNYDNAA